jgi:predicted metalloprotease
VSNVENPPKPIRTKEKMKNELKKILHLSLNEVEKLWTNYLISNKVYFAYLRVWAWSAVRYSGTASTKQDIFWTKYGKEKFYLKINKTRAAFGFQPINF